MHGAARCRAIHPAAPRIACYGRGMRRSMHTLFAAALALGACSSREAPPTAEARVAIAPITVDELDAQLARHACQAVDANGDATRRKLGIIPGAVLLADMDTLDNLPKDKATPLVFYCANTACGASEYAATKARVAGYTHVRVLPEGIAGWVKAGKQTAQL